MNMILKSGLVAAAAILIGSSPLVAEEKKITGNQLQELLAGKKAVDVTRDDHWFTLSPDGSALIASRGIEFPSSYESTDYGWCRTMTLPPGVDIPANRFEKFRYRCQTIGYDGEHVYFYMKDSGKKTNKYRIE